MANREFAEIELLAPFAEKMDVAVGIIDVKNYYIETEKGCGGKDRKMFEICSGGKTFGGTGLRFEPDSQMGIRQKLINMVKGAKIARERL